VALPNPKRLLLNKEPVASCAQTKRSSKLRRPVQIFTVLTAVHETLGMQKYALNAGEILAKVHGVKPAK
jgi:hypothetical protein